MAKKKMMKKRQSQILFLCALFAYPVLHKLVFYFGVNIRSFILVFQKYNILENTYSYVGFDNFRAVFDDIFRTKVLLHYLKNTAILYVVETFISIPLSIFSSYFVYKRVPLNNFFKVLFFLPNIVSSVVMVIMFKYFCEYAIPGVYKAIFNKDMPLILMEQPYAFKMMLVYTLWSGFASGIILYLGAMSRVGEGLEDAAKIDGANIMQEFWYVTMPAIYPMLTVFLITGLVGLFAGGGPIYTFYKEAAPDYVQTMGYFMLVKVIGQNRTIADYPYASAIGVIITLVATPLTFLLKYLLEKFGPSEE